MSVSTRARTTRNKPCLTTGHEGEHVLAVTLIINPVSGRGRVQANADHVVAALEARFGPIQVFRTELRGHGRDLARKAAEAGAELIAVMGGDGTISEVADGILSSANPQTALAVIPAGTGSDFARSFAKARSPQDWVSCITFPAGTAIDSGLIDLAGDRVVHVVNIASFGISGVIAHAVNTGNRPAWLSGKLLFFIRSIAAIARFRPIRISLSVDGREAVERDVTLVAIANGPVFGGGMRVAPKASTRDGQFDVIVVQGLSRLRLMLLFPSIYLGWHLGLKEVEMVRAHTVSARLLAGNGAIEVDGESAGTLPAEFHIRPATLNLAMRLRD